MANCMKTKPQLGLWGRVLVLLAVWGSCAIAQAQEAEAEQPASEQPAEGAGQEAQGPAVKSAVAAPESLDALLEQVEQGLDAEREAQNQRLEAFAQAKEQQAGQLEAAKGREARARAQSEALEAQFEANEVLLKEQEALLKERMGTLGELFGIVRQVAGDTSAHVRESVVSAQMPGRSEALSELAQSKALPSVSELEKLWIALQREMTEQGKVVRFPATVSTSDGQERETEVVRIGPYNLVADGKYLSWLPETSSLIELPRQPETRYVALVGSLEEAQAGSGPVPFAIDPSRGSLLSLLVQTPDMAERLEAGGIVGYTILVLGAIAAAFALLRLAYLLFVSLKISGQRREPTQVRTNNPLGRVLSTWTKERKTDVETLERKLDEAVLRETGILERYLWAVKVVAVVAPLMGLLGTVTGMIRTFQAITLFGTGDPKLMAGGISEALVTTMLGLVVAVPLVLLHSVLKSTSRRMSDILQEQAAGLIAVQSEAAHHNGAGPQLSTENAVAAGGGAE